VCAGGIGGPLVWAVNMQLGQILPYTQCGSRLYPTAIVSAVAAVVSLAGAGASWRARSWHFGAAARTVWFTAGVSALMGLAFAFPLLLQAVSGVLLTGCER
jgi:membrane protein YdbS with pleckstrin-like domain